MQNLLPCKNPTFLGVLVASAGAAAAAARGLRPCCGFPADACGGALACDADALVREPGLGGGRFRDSTWQQERERLSNSEEIALASGARRLRERRRGLGLGFLRARQPTHRRGWRSCLEPVRCE